MKKSSRYQPATITVEPDPSLIGYVRVSTEEQNAEMQRHALQRGGCAPTAIFEDIGVSGAAKRKPGREEALRCLRSGMTLVVWKLDRVSRDLLDLLTLLQDLEARGVGFRSLQHRRRLLGLEGASYVGDRECSLRAGACRIPLPEGHVGAEPVGRNHVREGLLLPRSYVLFHSIIGALRGSLSRFHLSMRPQFHHHNFATCRSHKHVRPG